MAEDKKVECKGCGTKYDTGYRGEVNNCGKCQKDEDDEDDE